MSEGNVQIPERMQRRGSDATAAQPTHGDADVACSLYTYIYSYCRSSPSRPHGKLTKVIVGEPLDLVAVDILSGLPSTPENFKYVLVITDYFTKWAEAYPLKDSEAPTCMRVLYNGFFSRFGLPRQLHSDQGKNFESKLFHEFCRPTGVHKSKTTPFHPQCDGQTERMNGTLLQMLRATCQDNPQNWPQNWTLLWPHIG